MTQVAQTIDTKSVKHENETTFSEWVQNTEHKRQQMKTTSLE